MVESKIVLMFIGELLQPFYVDTTASYHPDAIYSLTVPPCDSSILYLGFNGIFMSRILRKNLC